MGTDGALPDLGLDDQQVRVADSSRSDAGPESDAADGADVEVEAAQALENLAQLLDTEGCSMVDVVKTTVFLTDMADYAEVNEVYVAAFGDHLHGEIDVNLGNRETDLAVDGFDLGT